MQRITNKPLFDLGRLVATAGALAALEKTDKLWVITEADRSSMTLLLPEEY